MSAIDILLIGKNAAEAKQKNPKVINATLGTFYDEDKKMIIPFVKDKFMQIQIDNIFPYGTTNGGDTFKQNILNWVFDQTKEEIETHFKTDVIATPGGSGAISIAFNSYANPLDSVLISDIKWRYDFFTNAAKIKIEDFVLFENTKFNLTSFHEKLQKLTEQQHKVLVVINDPCHNPTGYQLSQNEWEEIINIMNQYHQNEITLLLDIAYFDYDPEGLEKTREKFLQLKKVLPHITPLLAFSASKSFSMYGLRLGALIGLFQTEKQAEYFKKHAYEDALGKWSTAPSVGIELFNEISKEKETYKKIITKITNQLTKRGNLFIQEASKQNLKHYPFKGGFFVLIPVDDPLKCYEKLVKEEALHVVPMKEGLRIALCSVTKDEIKQIVHKIKKTL